MIVCKREAELDVAKVKEGPLIRTLEVMVVVAPKAAVLATHA